MHPAMLWEAEGDRIRCGLCPHACLIPEGGRGYCSVRANIDGNLIALTYGAVSSIAVDPIEKKPVFHYCPGSMVLSIGSVGCSMRCGHCQNWSISRTAPDDRGVDLTTLSPGQIARLAEQYDSPGVAFTYNEPVIWAEYVLDCGRILKEQNRFVVMVTNGYVTQAGLDVLAEVVDVWRVDVKAFSEEAHRRLCKVVHGDAVRAMAHRAKHMHGMHVEVVTNVVPTINDMDDELGPIADWIARDLGAETPWHVTRFMPYLEFSDLPATPIETLRHARDLGRAAGLHYVYLGNVNEPGGEDTVCPSCGATVIRRTGFSVDSVNLKKGNCGACGAALGIGYITE